MLEKFKESVDKGNEFGALLTDLSKIFDSNDHKLLIAKLFWCGISPSSLNLIFSCLSNPNQVTVIKVISNMAFCKAQFKDHYYLTFN